MREGIILLDPDLNAQFINRSVRELWHISDEPAGRCPNIAELVGDAIMTGTYGVPREMLPNFIEQRIAQIRAGDSVPTDLQTSDDRVIRSQCDALPSGGRMLTYCDVTDLVRSAERMESLATTDSVTGLCNRRHFLARAEIEWSRSIRYGRPLSLLVIDIDNFKSINDSLGHDGGDEALCGVANTLKCESRAADVIGRFGGDEFLILLTEADIDQAALAGERLCRSIRALHLGAKDQRIGLSVSVGAATATREMRGMSELVKAADKALYRAKSMGRNCIAVATPERPLDMAAE
jgi:diguanylate cyclase (GGDEF)-like protein